MPTGKSQHGYAGEIVELSHQLDGILRVYRGPILLRALSHPLLGFNQRRAGLRPSTPNRKTKLPRIYSFAGRPELTATP